MPNESAKTEGARARPQIPKPTLQKTRRAIFVNIMFCAHRVQDFFEKINCSKARYLVQRAKKNRPFKYLLQQNSMVIYSEQQNTFDDLRPDKCAASTCQRPRLPDRKTHCDNAKPCHTADASCCSHWPMCMQYTSQSHDQGSHWKSGARPTL